VFGALLIVAAFSREIVNRTFRAPREAQPTTGTRVLAGAGGPSVEEPIDVRDHAGPGPYDDAFDEYDYDEEYDEESEARRLRWSVLFEVMIAIVILGVTALLVNAPPARSEATGGGTTSVILKSSAIWVDVTVTPAQAGSNELHVTALDTNGTLTNVEDLTLQMSLPRRDIAPIDVELRKLSPGHWTAESLTIPLAGDWRLESQVTVVDNQVEAVAGTIEIG
jgi:copper transport protein